MKKLVLSIVAIALISFGMVSCGSKSDPKDVALNFLNAFKKFDYENAKKYGTPKTDTMLEMFASFANMSGLPDSMKNKTKSIKFEIKDVKENGDKCIVTYTDSEKGGKEEKLNLEKKDGKWLVDLSKQDAMESSAEPTPTDTTATMEEAAPIAGKDSIQINKKP